VDEDGDSVDDRVTIQFLYRVPLMDLFSLTAMSVRIPCLPPALSLESFYSSCWWTTCYNPITMLHPSRGMDILSNQSHMRQQTHVTRRASCQGRLYTEQHSPLRHNALACLAASRTLLRLYLGQPIFRSQPVCGMQGENVLGA
jgi:hypothetical protein